MERELSAEYENPVKASDVISENDMETILRAGSFVSLEDAFLEQEKIVEQDIATNVPRECHMPSVDSFGSESGPKPDFMLHRLADRMQSVQAREASDLEAEMATDAVIIWREDTNRSLNLPLCRVGVCQKDAKALLRNTPAGEEVFVNERVLSAEEERAFLHRLPEEPEEGRGDEGDEELHFLGDLDLRDLDDDERRLYEFAGFVLPDVGDAEGAGNLASDAYRAARSLWSKSRQKSWKKFLTVTCNDRRTPGVRKLYDAVVSVLYDEYGDSLGFGDITRRIGGELVLQTRLWHRFVEKLTDFILHDPIQMCGKVEYLWGRYEFQQEGFGSAKSHFHFGVSVVPESTEQSVSRICGGPCFTDEAYGTDYHSLVDLGIVEASDEVYSEYEEFFQGENQKLQVHRCDATGGRCQKRIDAEGNTRCRFPFSAPCSKSYFEEFDLYYTEEDMEVLRKADLVGYFPSQSYAPSYMTNIDVGDRFGPVPELRGGKWHYAHSQGYKNIPTIPLLWAISQAACNCQECDSRFNHAYLSSYAAKCEFGKTVINVRDAGDFSLDARGMENTKISGARFLAKLKEQTEDRKKLLLREVCVSEIIWFTLGLPYVVTNVKFVHLSTKPAELRSAMLKNKVYRKVTGLSGVERAPHYKLKRYLVHEDLALCPWVDAAQRQVRIRSRSFLEFFEFCENRRAEGGSRNEGVGELLRDVVNPLRVIRGSDEENGPFWKRFVVYEEKPVVVVLKPLSATDPVKFLYHLALSMGNFVTERDLFRGSRNMLQILKNAGVLPENCVLEDGVALLKKFVMTQLRFMALSRRPFIREISLGLKVLEKVIQDGDMYHEPNMPLVTLEEMKESAERAEEAVIEPFLLRAPGQTEESFQQQRRTLQYVLDGLTKRQLGTGKSHLLLLAVAAAVSRGMNAVITALTAERARCLGGIHLHSLLKISVSSGNVTRPSSLAELAVEALYRDPVQFSFVRSIQILAVEEVGLLSAELLSVVDMIFRGVKGVARPFGGAHVIATGDPGQLTPCDGTTVFGSVQMITTFAPIHLDHPVRSAGDEDLQRLIRLIHPAGFPDQGPVLSDEQVTEFLSILDRRCRQNVSLSHQHLPPGILMVVGKRKAEEELEEDFIKREKASRQDWREFLASDLVDNEGTWISAAENVSIALNRKVLAKYKLFVFPGARVRMTENGTFSGHTFSQGQSGIVQGFVDEEDNVKIQVSLVPPGQILEECDVDNLPVISVTRTFTQDVWLSYRSRLAKREQFPLKLDIAATCHKILGSTLARVAFKLGEESSAYGLWDRKQLLVIISRVRSLDHVFPVGEWSDIEKQVRALLVKEAKEEKRLCEFLRNLDVLSHNPRRVVETFAETLDLADALPVPEMGCVYLIFNSDDPKTFYIGETLNLRRRYSQHRTSNRTFGSRLRVDAVRLFCFITGFEAGSFGVKYYLKKFEDEWQRLAGQGGMSRHVTERPLAMRPLAMVKDYVTDVEPVKYLLSSHKRRTPDTASSIVLVPCALCLMIWVVRSPVPSTSVLAVT
ncbi:unnamed protein product [Cyprideis torosa]|uniref:ATP-dependent DNA helicase n=1 Tax=Cyprideis torosa TaxID=163714 RepID=A0A7R8WLC3_9CRUS|nr:unnamed protein product [Cyprideis torosa]CAG0902353.1 unnamed protein product [Cyprideis torosa]